MLPNYVQLPFCQQKHFFTVCVAATEKEEKEGKTQRRKTRKFRETGAAETLSNKRKIPGVSNKVDLIHQNVIFISDTKHVFVQR